ncbi:hypothetical protein MMC14_005570 [Varicellaria rhodocarpa]|nr:hypothetical protein [Varicellaria rhodocarpa]
MSSTRACGAGAAEGYNYAETTKLHAGKELRKAEIQKRDEGRKWVEEEEAQTSTATQAAEKARTVYGRVDAHYQEAASTVYTQNSKRYFGVSVCFLFPPWLSFCVCAFSPDAIQFTRPLNPQRPSQYPAEASGSGRGA